MLNATARRLLVTAGAVAAIAAFAPPGLANPDDPFPPKPTEKKKKRKGASLTQDQVYSLGYWQAKRGNYAAALATLRSADDQDDPRVETMIGFTLRKLGRVEEALGYYHKALATRPDATTTRQYLGEAYLQMGDPARARAQLAEIGRLCGTACEDYTALARAIARYERPTET